VLVAPLAHLVPAACYAIKERAYKLVRQTSISVSRPFILSTYSLLVFKQIFLRCFYINHVDVYQQRCFVVTMVAWHSSVTNTTHFISNWLETLVDVSGANGVNDADFAGVSVAVLVTTTHLHIIRRAATPPKHVTACDSI
jgi:hypothetical protein